MSTMWGDLNGERCGGCLDLGEHTLNSACEYGDRASSGLAPASDDAEGDEMTAVSVEGTTIYGERGIFERPHLWKVSALHEGDDLSDTLEYFVVASTEDEAVTAVRRAEGLGDSRWDMWATREHESVIVAECGSNRAE